MLYTDALPAKLYNLQNDDNHDDDDCLAKLFGSTLPRRFLEDANKYIERPRTKLCTRISFDDMFCTSESINKNYYYYSRE